MIVRLGFAIAVFVCGSLLACDGSNDTSSDVVDRAVEREETTIAATTELSVLWDMLPHRISLLEASFTHDGEGGELVGRNDGGEFGALDTPFVRYGATVWRSRQLAAVHGTADFVITPADEAAGEPYSVARAVMVPAESLTGASALLAFIRGYRISTDEYDERPAFESDPDLPYDAIGGFTTQGFGVRLGEPVIVGSEIALDIDVRNTLGVSDRADMNNAIPQATTWVRVDFTIVGAFDSSANVVRGEASYTIGAADYGVDTVHEHASESDQEVVLQGVSGPRNGLFGLTGFDFWLNLEGHHDPECVVVQDEVNSWGEEISGPGRYLREASIRLWDETYEPASGEGSAKLDLMLSNSSAFREVGNLCLGVRGDVGMLQFADDAASSAATGPVELELISGENGRLPVVF